MPQPQNATLFVYGTLQPEEREGARLGPLLASWPARLRGRLYDLPAGYPALVDDPDGWVEGVVVVLAEPGRLLALDDYEGPLYQRQLRTAVGNGRSVQAWCWSVPPEGLPGLLAQGARWLPGGRWPPVDGA